MGQLQLLIKRVEEKREDLRQKRKDIEDTLSELDNVEEACLTRLAENRCRHLTVRLSFCPFVSQANAISERRLA